MSIIDAFDLEKRFGDRRVLAGVSLTLSEGERVGLVGSNGCGKSTLGRVLAGLDVPDGGRIARRRGARVDYLAQEPRLPAGATVQSYVAESLDAWTRARTRYDEATAALERAGLDRTGADVASLVAEQAVASEALVARGGWDRLYEVDAVISHLGLDDPQRPVETLSGGERRRAALARVLVGRPDLAILDEPTNHLDIETIEWLEEYLANRFAGALLLITHDRYLLDRVTDRTLEIDAGLLESYNGGYGAYLEGKAERQAHVERTERNRQNFLRTELEWMRRGPKARATKQKARLDRARESLETRAPVEVRTAELRLDATRQGRTILDVSGLRVERDGRPLVAKLDLAVSAGQRIGVLGPNGVGKTSLLLALQGELPAAAGSVTLGARTQIGYLEQARGDLDDEATVFETVAEGRVMVEVGGESMQVASYLERFLFDRNAQRVKVGELSGGERARVCLARLLCQETNLLLLDEPTNDLDIGTLSALESMLCDYGGSALIISHDRWFLDRVATSMLAFESDAGGGEGILELHAGNYSEYRERKAARESVRAAVAREPAVAQPASARKPQRASAPRKLSFNEERELAGLFERIEAAEGQVAELVRRLSDPTTYQKDRSRKDGSEIASLRNELSLARLQAEALTTRWEELEAKRAPSVS